MKRLLPLLMILLSSTACTKSVSPDETYLEAAARHCDYRKTQFGWLQTIIATGQYQKPDATLAAPIQRISLSNYGGTHVFLLDSDLSSCVVCPWAILDCDGKPFLQKVSLTPTRDNIIWTR